VEFNVAYQALMTIGQMFPFKDKIKNAMEQSLVVYKYTCKCGAEYIGKTERILHYRVKEHAKPDSTSAVRQHLDKSKTKKWREQHHINFESVEMIDAADNDRKLRIKELVHILNRNPEINKQLGSQSEYEIKTLLIQAYPQFRTTK
jgi:predicted GIY-YIG superfamily endonuclease